MGMALDENLPVLLERAAGPDPGSGDEADVRRRARRYVRRRRAAVGAAVAALVVPGLFVAGWFRPTTRQRWSRRTWARGSHVPSRDAAAELPTPLGRPSLQAGSRRALSRSQNWYAYRVQNGTLTTIHLAGTVKTWSTRKRRRSGRLTGGTTTGTVARSSAVPIRTSGRAGCAIW